MNKKAEIPKAKSLKLLCLLSFIGFIYCMALDSAKFITYQFYSPDNLIEDSNAYEIISNELNTWSMKGVDVSEKGIQLIALNFFLRSTFDVLALFGVALMFYQLKIGYSIYVFFQLLYIVVPFLIFLDGAFSVVPLQITAVNLVYIGLFTTQRKHLKSKRN